MFTLAEQQAIGQAVLDGTFQKLTSEQQMRLMMRGLMDASEKQLTTMMDGLNRAFNRGIIKFSPERLYQRIKGMRMEGEVVATSADPQSVTEAAHSLSGFDTRRLIKPEERSETIPLSQLPQNRGVATNMPLTQPRPVQQQPVVVFPNGYESMTNDQKIEVIRNMINSRVVHNISGTIFKDIDTTDVNAVKAVVEKYFTFITGAHHAIDILQLITIGRIVKSMKLTKIMTANGCVDNPEEPHLLEVPMEMYAADMQGQYDFAFLLQCNQRSKGVLILVNSIPVLDTTGKWMTMFEAKTVAFGKDRKNPFMNRHGCNTNNDGVKIQDVINHQA